ncbi:MAG: 3-phosphoshikimate 1-carboxyvinyltransferase [Syntrophorhabdaceae bacterium]|nr:3-phosphoshikimate 1-carboxyvinyltransferase [Syntrophorhabdaceae bacterium]
MRVVQPSSVEGVICAPPSKSSMIRAVAASLLAYGTSEIENPTYCDDALAAINIASSLGAEVYRKEEKVVIKGNGNLLERAFIDHTLDCNESGLCLRMFTPIAALSEEEITLYGRGSLLLRPVGMVEKLNLLNGRCKTENGYVPVKVKGRLKSGKITINGNEGSQFISGLIMALSVLEGDSIVKVDGLKSKPYVRLTLETMDKFGVEAHWRQDIDEFFIPGRQRYKETVFAVEGDWSGAAFFLVAGAIAGSIRIEGLDVTSSQGDRAILDVLSTVGASVEGSDRGVSVRKGELKAFSFDASDSPDLFPPLVALAANCEGTSIIYGVDRLKHKESNRAITLMYEFSKLGIDLEISQNKMAIRGGAIKGGVVDSHNDHRIAMACAIAGLNGRGPVTIHNHLCVAKSYPNFFEELDRVRRVT